MQAEIKLNVNHSHAYLLEAFGDSLRLEMPCLLAADSDNTSPRLLITDKKKFTVDVVTVPRCRQQACDAGKCYGFSDRNLNL